MPRMIPRIEPRKPEPAPVTGSPTPAAERDFILRSKRACLSINSPQYFRHAYATIEQRKEFALHAPLAYYGMWGFERGRLFARPSFLNYLDEHSPAPSFFDGPEMKNERDWRPVLEARARWWVENRLPLTGSERAWIDQNLPALKSAAGQCPQETEA